MNVKYICFCFQKWDFKQKTLPLTLTHALSQTYTIQNFLSVTYTLTKSLSLSPGPPTLSLSLSLSHNFQHKTLFSSQTHTQLCTLIGSLLDTRIFLSLSHTHTHTHIQSPTHFICFAPSCRLKANVFHHLSLIQVKNPLGF